VDIQTGQQLLCPKRGIEIHTLTGKEAVVGFVRCLHAN
jgi:hypothetical protein